jgi:hypothetical protein
MATAHHLPLSCAQVYQFLKVQKPKKNILISNAHHKRNELKNKSPHDLRHGSPVQCNHLIDFSRVKI